jgi:GC-rich sequence DNA-binding factor
LDSFHWYQGLYEYSRPGATDESLEERELGSDGDLVSSMITTAIIPRLSKMIEGGALDVYSEKHVRRAIDLVEELEASIEAGNVKIHVGRFLV